MRTLVFIGATAVRERRFRYTLAAFMALFSTIGFPIRASEISSLACVVPVGERASGGTFDVVTATHQLSRARLLLHVQDRLLLVRAAPGTVHIEKINADTGAVTITHELPDIGVLFGAEKGLFLMRTKDGKESVEAVGNTGWVRQSLVIHGVGVLIRAEGGLYLAQSTGQNINLVSVGSNAPVDVEHMVNVQGVGVFLQAENRWHLARFQKGSLSIESAGPADTGQFLKAHALPDVGALIQATGGLFFAHVSNGEPSVELASKVSTGKIVYARQLSRVGILIKGLDGLFVLKKVDGKYEVEVIGPAATSPKAIPGMGVLIKTQGRLFAVKGSGQRVTYELVDIATIGLVRDWQEVAGKGVLVQAEQGWFFARGVGGDLVLESIVTADTGVVRDWLDIPPLGTLFRTENGWFSAREKEGKMQIAPVAGVPDTGSIEESYELAGAWVLIRGENGWFSARGINGEVRIETVDGADTGAVEDWYEIEESGALANAENGWFFARETRGRIRFEPTGYADTGMVIDMHTVPGAGVLINSLKGWFLAVQSPLELAEVAPKNPEALAGVPPGGLLDLVLTVDHPCSRVLEQIGTRMIVTAPDGKREVRDVGKVRFANGKANVPAPVAVTPGVWRFQLVSIVGEQQRLLGKQSVRLEFDAPPSDWRSVLEEWGWWSAAAFAVLLAIANIILFVAARRSTWAWRVATDAAFGTTVLRLVTIALSHVPQAQVWILDLYFRAYQSMLDTVDPFVPLPLSSVDSAMVLSDVVSGPPWIGRRIWVQGNSGMGKTALFQSVTRSHFRDQRTALDAFKRWGCIVVPFAARNYAAGGEDRPDPAWVIEGVRSTLSERGLTFEDDKLLRRILHTGTIAVAIDGLHEAGRTNSVEAFARQFEAAPMFVTSQEPGGRLFENWKLPVDVRAYTAELLRAHLGVGDAEVVMARLVESGLNEEIRSGYDVRLVIDLARSDPHNAVLPTSRIALYDAVIEVGWPDVAVELRRDQLNRTSAAAWRMVSERQPNEDKRRLVPGEDLAAELLFALADAPERDRSPVRLVRRVGIAFEFVHDQMHAYLAARWFAQEGRSIEELRTMIQGSSIWADAIPARRTLWGFVADLLDDERLLALWAYVDDEAEWDLLRRELKAAATRRNLQEPSRQESAKSPTSS